MKWTYSVKNKLMASAALLSLCLLVLASHFIDRNHTENVKTAIGTLYEDRLVAEVYILKMTSLFYQVKETLRVDSDETTKGLQVHALLLKIRNLSDSYQETKFTEAEKRKADELLITLDEFEASPFASNQTKLSASNEAIAILEALSVIQLEESKQIMAHAETLYQRGKTSSQFVFAVIIVILIVLQALVFASKSIIPVVKPNHAQMN
ncbi:MAG TPA: hypothetical protein DIW47_03565 [Bacteroidetes bacterium]|nr:hypothetical protein [Bacteroidota bacterium]